LHAAPIIRLAIAPTAMPAIAMTPIAVTIPITVAIVECADHQRTYADSDRGAAVRTAMPIRPAMKAGATALCRLRGREGGKGSSGGQRRNDKFLHVIISLVEGAMILKART
jgi:hypothetical protein